MVGVKFPELAIEHVEMLIAEALSLLADIDVILHVKIVEHGVKCRLLPLTP